MLNQALRLKSKGGLIVSSRICCSLSALDHLQSVLSVLSRTSMANWQCCVKSGYFPFHIFPADLLLSWCVSYSRLSPSCECWHVRLVALWETTSIWWIKWWVKESEQNPSMPYWPFLSCVFLLCQNKTLYRTIHLKLCHTKTSVFMQI